MIVLDTTVLVYATGGEHPLKQPCERLFDAIGAGDVAATTSVSAIQEFAHVRARRAGRAVAIVQASEYLQILGPLLPVLEEHVDTALELFESHPELDAFDAFLAAAALAADARALVSADRAFAAVPGLRHVDPSTPELDEIIRD